MQSALLHYLDEVTFGLDGLSKNSRRTAPRGILAQIIDSLPCAALVADDHGHYLMANRVASELTGFRPAELRRLSVWDLTPDASQHDCEILWRAFLQQHQQNGEYQLVTRTGRVLNAQYAARADVLPGVHLSLLDPTPSRM